MAYELRLVQTLTEAMRLMAVRNACREGMTRNRQPITQAVQARFWRGQIQTGKIRCYLFIDRDEDVVAGYGVLRPDDPDKCDYRKVWMTAGLAPAYRGKRLSRTLITLVTEMAYCVPGEVEVLIEVYDDNLALRGDIEAGFERILSTGVVEDDGQRRVLHVMRHRRDRRLRPEEAGRLAGSYDWTPTDLLQEIEEVDRLSR